MQFFLDNDIISNNRRCDFMQGLLLPSCAIVFSTLLCILFFSKKRIDNLETKIYAVILLILKFLIN